MKRSRMVTRAKDLIEPRHETQANSTEIPVEGKTVSPIEELVAVSVKTFEAQEVVNAQGEKLGRIEDLMINPNSGRIIYAVLSFGGFLGMGDKYFAIPWEQICIDNRWNYQDIYRQKLVVNIAKEVLEKAPGFNKASGPRNRTRN